LKLQAESGAEKVYFRAAVGSKIEAVGDGWYKIDGWKMKVESTVVPTIRQSSGKSELIVPVPFKDGKAEFKVEYVW
jgi:hypothetical protein